MFLVLLCVVRGRPSKLHALFKNLRIYFEGCRDLKIVWQVGKSGYLRSFRESHEKIGVILMSVL